MAWVTFDLSAGRHLGRLAICLYLAAGGAAAQEGPGAGRLDDQEISISLTLPPDIVDVTWEWVGFQTPKDAIVVTDPGSYTLTFGNDGTVTLQADCNRGVTSYVLSQDNRITLDPIATTRMMCDEGSLEHVFTSNLERVSSFFQLEGDLLLEQPFDSGTLRFRPASAEPQP
ncbi:META domain-containing protein [Devosia sp.]|uniref:META domain-containing protein n=1 Tax=Devosia sp. TaxID=1871048 RepID=UPI002FC58610